MVLATTLVVGTGTLALTLQVPQGSGWFTVTSLALAAIWTVGALASGPVVFLMPPGARTRHATVGAALVGVAAFAAFVVVSRVTTQLPFVAPALAGVLDKADTGFRLAVLAVAVANGVAEELFFRGALFAAIGRLRGVVLTTLIYVIVTAATGNVALVAAAVVLGALLAVERRRTGAVLPCMITHVVWSVLMLLAFPR